MSDLVLQRYESPEGTLMLGSFEGRLCMCDWENSPLHRRNLMRIEKGIDCQSIVGTSQVIATAKEQLNAYFTGDLKQFDIPLLFIGTDFQKQVWESLLRIPYGATSTYGEQAQRMGRPKAVRAVARANGSNAISIIVPCHRIVGRNGKLTGYAGGIEAKRNLLNHEFLHSI